MNCATTSEITELSEITVTTGRSQTHAHTTRNHPASGACGAAAVRHRTKKTRGCLKRNTAMMMVFKLIKEAEKRWLKSRGKKQLPKLVQGVTFSDGIETIENQTKSAA
jgi:hypothetical protein